MSQYKTHPSTYLSTHIVTLQVLIVGDMKFAQKLALPALTDSDLRLTEHMTMLALIDIVITSIADFDILSLRPL